MYFVYILAGQSNKMIYVGVTNDLHRRITEHKGDLNNGFTQKYHIHKLVYFEEFSEINYAIAREKQLKHWRRDKKNALIERINPEWKDLSEYIHFM